MSESRHGRHRAAGRYNPAAELSSIVAGAATPLRKGSVVLAASGGLVAAIAVAVAVWMTRERNRVDQAALGLILGGALGNILDRVRLGFVIDYADFHLGAWRPFLVFNLADAAITLGVIVLLVRALFVREKAPESGSGSPVSENRHA